MSHSWTENAQAGFRPKQAKTILSSSVPRRVLIGAGPAMAEAVPRLPNEFEYWRLWAECGEPYLYGDHTTRTCMSGRIVYEHFGGGIDANNRQTVVAHVRYKGTPVSVVIPAHW